MNNRHLARIIIRWWREGLTIDEIQSLTTFTTRDTIAAIIAAYETQRKDHQ